jgi:hypothetical protein
MIAASRRVTTQALNSRCLAKARQRNIVMIGRPHLPATIRQWFGDSPGYWEGNTLVIDVTNFSPKTDYWRSRENLHLVERWTRTRPHPAPIRGHDLAVVGLGDRALKPDEFVRYPSVVGRPW